MVSSEDRMNICLGEKYLRLQGSATENFFFTILFPWLCIIGIVGNCLNLTVLLNSEIRHRSSSVNERSNVLLVALALCDILFLILMIPHSLANFDFFGLDMMFRTLYLPSKIHLISLANWCSAVATWLVIVICAERLIGIRSFQHTKTNWSYCTTANVIICIIAGSALLTSYNHFSYHCVVKLLCNETQIISKCFDVIHDTWPGNHINMTPAAIRFYVRWSQVANVIIVIVLPIAIMLALNITLLFVVRKQSFLMYSRLKSASTNFDCGTKPITCPKCKRKMSLPCALALSSVKQEKRKSFDSSNCAESGGATKNDDVCPKQSLCHASTFRKNSFVVAAIGENGTQTNLFRRSIDQTVQFQAEHRVTVTVCAIVTCFTITQGPSAIVLSLSFLSGHQPPFVNSNVLWYHVNSLTGFLVIIGKTLNFVLFCLSSAAFRRRLVKILRKKFLFLKERRNSMLGNSSTGGGNGNMPTAFPTVNPFHNNNGSLFQKKLFNERKFLFAL